MNVFGSLGMYVILCFIGLELVFDTRATVRGDDWRDSPGIQPVGDEPKFKGQPASYWAGEVKANVPSWRAALAQLSPDAKECAPAIIELFRGESLQPVRGSHCTPP